MDSQESSSAPQFESIISSALSFLYSPTLTPYLTTGKTIALTRWVFVNKVMSPLFNTLSRFVTAFFPQGASFNFTAAVTICCNFGAQEDKVCHYFHCFPIYLPWSDETGCYLFAMKWWDQISVFWMLSFKPAFAIFYREGYGTPLQYSCLENPMDGGAW